MAGWRGDDEKNVRRMRKVLEQKRKEKKLKRRLKINGNEEEDTGFDDETDYPRNWEESISPEDNQTY